MTKRHIIFLFLFTVLNAMYGSNSTIHSAVVEDSETQEPQIISISPAANSFIDEFKSGSSIVFSTNFDDRCGGFKLTLKDYATGNILYEDFTTDYDGKSWKMDFFEDVVLSTGSSYNLELEGHESNSQKSPIVASVSVLYKGGYPILNITPDAGKYKELTTFSFSCSDGITYAEGKKVVLYYADSNNIVEEMVVKDDGKGQLSCSLSTPITESNDYTLYVPNGCFMLSGSYPNKEMLLNYKVESNKSASDYFVTLDPVENSTLSRLDKITITFNNMARWGENETQASPGGYNYAPYVIDENGDKVAETTRSKLRDSICVITLKQPIKIAGKYKLIIPEYAFVLGDWGNHTNEYMEFDYFIEPGDEPGDDITFLPAESSEVTSLHEVVLTFNKINYTDYNPSASKPWIADSDGCTVSYGTMKWGDMKNQLKLILDETITELGTYSIHIPAGSCSLDGELYQKEITIKYTVVNSAH